MLKLTLPKVSFQEAQIRAIGASTLPTSNNFWFEDIPQLPGRIFHELTIATDAIGDTHELWLGLDGDPQRLRKQFVAAESTTVVQLALQAGVYDYSIKNSTEEYYGSFQVSIKELVWWAWTQQLVPYFQDLDALSSRLNNPFYLFFFEVAYPAELLALNSSPYAIRSFAKASNAKALKSGFESFASAIFDIPVSALTISNQVIDASHAFSYLALPFASPVMARRGAFLAQHPEVISATWDYATVEDSIQIDPYSLSMNFSAPLEIINDFSKILAEKTTDQARLDFINTQISENFLFEVRDANNKVVLSFQQKDGYKLEGALFETYNSALISDATKKYWLRCVGYVDANGTTHALQEKYELIKPIPLLMTPKLPTVIRIVWELKGTWVVVQAPSFVIWQLVRNGSQVIEMSGSTTGKGILLPDDNNYPSAVDLTTSPLIGWQISPDKHLVVEKHSNTFLTISALAVKPQVYFTMDITGDILNPQTGFNLQLLTNEPIAQTTFNIRLVEDKLPDTPFFTLSLINPTLTLTGTAGDNPLVQN